MIGVLIFCVMIAGGIYGISLSIKGVSCLRERRIRSGLIYLAVGMPLWLGMVALIVLPAIICIHPKSPRAECCNNLSQIGKALKMYSMDHDDVYPVSLSELIPEYVDNDKFFYCPKSGTEEQRIRYIIVPSLSETNAPNSVHAHCPVGSHDGRGGNILYLDGAVMWARSAAHCSETNAMSFEKLIERGHDRNPGGENAGEDWTGDADQTAPIEDSVVSEQEKESWNYRCIAEILDAVRVADTNAVVLVNSALLTTNHFSFFEKEHPDDIDMARSSFLTWQHFVAVRASQRSDIFGRILVEYYYDSFEEAKARKGQDQIVIAVVKLIEQGPILENLGESKGTYDIDSVKIENDTATVMAAFRKFLASRGYTIVLKKMLIEGVEVWIPVVLDNTWLS